MLPVVMDSGQPLRGFRNDECVWGFCSERYPAACRFSTIARRSVRDKASTE